MNVTYVPDALSAYVKVIGSLSEQSTDTISNKEKSKGQNNLYNLKNQVCI